MSVIRVCFLGTPEFAAEHLEALIKDSHYEVVGVVTQPDRPAGRKMVLTPSPVKKLALEKNIPVLTPEKLKNDVESLSTILSWKAEVAVVVAFGQILPQTFLDSFEFGAVNVHGSLLPLYRGAAPIQRSLQNGDSVTGVSLQKMVFKLDAGPIIGERVISLDDQINATELYRKMSVLGQGLLEVELMDYLRGNLAPKPQDESKVTLAHKISKEESLLNWAMSARQIHNTVRAFAMGPGTYVFHEGKRLKLHKTEVISGGDRQAGEIVSATESSLVVQCGKDRLSLIEVQPESKSKMNISDYLKSQKFHQGALWK